MTTTTITDKTLQELLKLKEECSNYKRLYECTIQTTKKMKKEMDDDKKKIDILEKFMFSIPLADIIKNEKFLKDIFPLYKGSVKDIQNSINHDL